MIITTSNITHDITLPTLSIIGKVGEYLNVAYEAQVYINSKIDFIHEYDTTFTQYPEQIGVSTSLVEDIIYNREVSPVSYGTTVVDGIVYREATEQVAIGTITYREVTTPVYDIPAAVGIATTVREDKSISCFSHFNVSFQTSQIEDFTSWDDLTEEQVIGWIPQDSLLTKQQEHQATLEVEMDKVLNPLKYYRDSPVTPWRRRADEASAENN
jgi:hypothetical protein